jgi:LAGLIDADG DNA endonuclease family
LGYLIKGDRSLDKNGSRLVFLVNNFTLNETKRLQLILLSKFNISSYIVRTTHSDNNRGFILKIPNKEIEKVRELVSPFVFTSLKYKLGI